MTKMKSFEDKLYKIVRDAATYIHEELDKSGSISLYSIENTIYETLLSQKYKGIHGIYELIEAYMENGKGYIKGVDSCTKEEYIWPLYDLSPDTICLIADRITENISTPSTVKELENVH